MLLSIKTIAFLILIFLWYPAFSLPDDEKQPMILSADTADINQLTHSGEYKGKVQFDQGSRHLRAAKAITLNNDKNKLISAIVYGNQDNPAHYWEKTALDKPAFHAYAQEIRYYPEKHLVELIGDARLEQGNDSFSAPKICYDTLKQHVTSIPNSNQRTTIIIHSSKK